MRPVTGETGEFASENVVFGLNPWVVPATPQDYPSNWRELAVPKNLRSLADTSEGARLSAYRMICEIGDARNGKETALFRNIGHYSSPGGTLRYCLEHPRRPIARPEPACRHIYGLDIFRPLDVSRT
jgi:hypothetical protein